MHVSINISVAFVRCVLAITKFHCLQSDVVRFISSRKSLIYSHPRGNEAFPKFMQLFGLP